MPTPSGAGGHDLHLELSLALHEAVARKLTADLVEQALRRIEEWLSRGGNSTPLLLRWREILSRPLPEVRAVLVQRSEEAAWLRKASPFAGTIPARERERIVRECRKRLESAT